LPDFDFDAEFQSSLDAAISETQAKSQFPKQDWLAAGVKPPQDESWWRLNGPGMVRAFADWYTSQPDVKVWITPDGRPAIELDLTVTFGRVPVKMTPDLILQAGSALIVVDQKSGSSQPDNKRQLGLYACGLEKAYGVRPKYGTFFMAKGVSVKGSESRVYFLPPISLDGPEYSVEYFTREFAIFDRAVAGGIFLANPGKQCHTCGVNRACVAFGGDEAALFDPSHPRYQGGR